MVKIQLPCLHIVYSARYSKEIVVNALLKYGALIENFAHDIRVLGISDILVAVATEEVLKRKTVLLAVFKSLADTLNFNVVIAERSAAAGERSIPRE
jgi:hypothetical protein